MSGNGHHNGNGNGHRRGPLKNVFAESAGLGVAEFASIATSLGVIAVAEDIAPNMLKSASHAVGKVIEPYLLDPAESFLKAVCKLEECQPDMNKSREQRADDLAKISIIFSTAFVASLGAKIMTRKVINNVLDLAHSKAASTGKPIRDFLKNNLVPDKHDRKVVYWDEGFHIGSLLLLNTGIAKQTDDMIHGASNILQKVLGWSKEKSDRVASMTMIWEVPNILGWMAGVGAIAHDRLSKKTR